MHVTYGKYNKNGQGSGLGKSGPVRGQGNRGGGSRFDMLREEVDENLTNRAVKGNDKAVKPSDTNMMLQLFHQEVLKALGNSNVVEELVVAAADVSTNQLDISVAGSFDEVVSHLKEAMEVTLE
ncbi:hypothetical protein ACOSP7_020754 [Xanthoceras sorbifolium]